MKRSRGEGRAEGRLGTRCEAVTHSRNRPDDVGHYARSALGVPDFLPKQQALRMHSNVLTKGFLIHVMALTRYRATV